MSPSTLEPLVRTARDAVVHPEAARRALAGLERWGTAAPVPWWRAGVWAAAGALAVAAILLLWWRAAPPPVIAIGDRVAIIAEPGAQYRVLGADASHTAVLVEEGTVTARLWKGRGAYALTLRGGGVVAAATGTIYSLTVEAGRPSVRVHEGTVEVRPDQGAAVRVAADTSWPAKAQQNGAQAARRLLAWERVAPTEKAISTPVPETDAPPAGLGPDASVSATPDGGRDAGLFDAPTSRPSSTRQRDASAVEPAAQEMSPADRWRVARLRRGQGQFREALRECLIIVDGADATWAPIALVEAARLALEPLADPSQAIDLARRMRTRWPKHTLMTEMRAIECRALKQVGRGAECAVIDRNSAP